MSINKNLSIPLYTCLFLITFFLMYFSPLQAEAQTLNVTASPSNVNLLTASESTINWTLSGYSFGDANYDYAYMCYLDNNNYSYAWFNQAPLSGSARVGVTGVFPMASQPIPINYTVQCDRLTFSKTPLPSCSTEGGDCYFVGQTPLISRNVTVTYTPPPGPAQVCRADTTPFFILDSCYSFPNTQICSNVPASRVFSLVGEPQAWHQGATSCTGSNICSGLVMVLGDPNGLPLCAATPVQVNLAPGPCGSGSMTLTVAFPPGDPAPSYRLERSINGGTTWDFVGNVSLAQLVNPFPINNLGPNQAFGVRITPNVVGGVADQMIVNAPPMCPCAPDDINRCRLGPANHGQSINGTCPFAGSCNYTCNNGTWQQNSNSCAAPLPPSVNLQFITPNNSGVGGQQNPQSPNRPGEATQ